MIGTNHFPIEGAWGEVALDLGIDPEEHFVQIDTELAWVFGVVTALNGPSSYTSAQQHAAFFAEVLNPWAELVGREIADSTTFFRLVTAQPAFGTISDR